jgi:hypothetical protein
VFLFYSNRMGCLGSIGLSLLITAIVLFLIMAL